MLAFFLKIRVFRYLAFSCFVAVLDYVFTIILYNNGLDLIISHLLGMLLGNLTQFSLLYKFFYKKKVCIKEFAKFESTFIVGLGLSTAIIWASYRLININAEVSKVISMVLTFAILYIIREYTLNRGYKVDIKTIQI